MNVSQLITLFFFFFFVKTKKQILFSLLFTTYYGGEESNYRYIYSFFYFFFQVQDNPKGLWVFFYQLGLLSPPPWGWSTGFITTPLTTGRLPSQHLDPALPKLFWFTPTFLTCPTVAEQFLDIKRTSPEGNFNVADFPLLQSVSLQHPLL